MVNLKKFFQDDYLFSYIAGLCSIQLTSDIQLSKIWEHIESLMKSGIQTKYPIIKDHFKVCV